MNDPRQQNLAAEEDINGSCIPSTIPQVKDQVSQEFELCMLDINCGAQAADIFGHEVAKDDASHRGFARTRLAHEQDLLLCWLGLEIFHLETCFTTPFCNVSSIRMRTLIMVELLHAGVLTVVPEAEDSLFAQTSFMIGDMIVWRGGLKSSKAAVLALRNCG